jgi:hypothetical protein
MSSVSFKCSKMADIEALLPGFRTIWPTIKEACKTSQRCPKGIAFTDTVAPVHLNDGECGKRFSLDLRDMSLSAGFHISSGEWACFAGSNPQSSTSTNNDQAVDNIPTTHALLTCVYHDYYRYFTITIQVNPTNMPKQLPKTA